MKHFTFSFLFLTVWALGVHAQQIAFPGAEGFGKYATGGRTGSVYHVTNLNDSGEGSFREAVSSPNRIVVFDVAGVIQINSAIAIDSNLYIAGQTAPGEGITIYGNRVTFTEAHNCICRYMRFRMGVVGPSGKDASGLASGKNMIFDHVSVSWGRDENFSINWDQKGVEPTNITLQNSIISQGLLTHSAGGLIQTNGGVTLFRNLYVDNSTRNNKVKGVNQYVNNLVYNWGSAAYIMGGDSEGESFANVESNYFIMGPEKGGAPISDGNANFHIYANDNWFDNNLDNNLNGFEIPFADYTGSPDFQTVPYNYPNLPKLDAKDLYENLIPSVGASLPYRDYADYYVINEVKSLGAFGSFISDESILPFGPPSSWQLWAGLTRIDTDNDGMPDEWEDTNGTNKLIDDAMILAENGYANIENYINSISQENSQPYLRTPLNFAAQPASTSSIEFSWLDYTLNETGFILERNVNGAFIPVDTINANSEKYILNGLLPEETDTFRLRAFNNTMNSPYSIEIIAKSKPETIDVTDPSNFVADLTWNGQSSNLWDKFSQNWQKETIVQPFVDGSKTLFDNTPQKNQTIKIEEQVSIGTLFVNSDYNYTFEGTGTMTGEGSINKTGTGELTLNTLNSYTGQTVIWDGTVNIDTLANGGQPSSIGASANYNFNLVFKGGKLNYTGASDSIDRSILLSETGNVSIENENTILTMTSGKLSGTGGLIKSGKGTLALQNGVGNTYKGETHINEGTLAINLNLMTKLEDVLGTSGIVHFNGGNLQIENGQSSSYETYDFTIDVPEGAKGGFLPFRNCSIACNATGKGDLELTIPYVREYITGDWNNFYGTIHAIGGGITNEGSQFLLNNTVGFPNSKINLKTNTKVVCWKNASTMYIGGLSGEIGTSLAGADKKNKAATMTWIVGGANTNETFHGLITNECSSAAYKGVTTIVKEGTGYWRLTGNNLYAGTTTVKQGTLIVNGQHSGTGTVRVESGAKLAGKGTLPCLVEILDKGSIEPGDSNIDTLTLKQLIMNPKSQFYFDIDKTSGINDVLLVTDSASILGTLNLNIEGTIVEGDSFTLIRSANFADSCNVTINPATPGKNLIWEFNKGILKAVKDPLSSADSQVNTNSFNMEITPNPVHNKLTVQLGNRFNHIDIKVVSITGGLQMQTLQTHCSSFEIDLSEFSNGIYFLVVVADGTKLTTQKVIKE